MDYEKKYDEALERAKKLTSDLTTLQAIREFIFPELKESEDEKIRKVLIECAKHSIFRNLPLHGFSIDKIIAYLERQKEQKPAGEEYEVKVGRSTHRLKVSSRSDIEKLLRQEKEQEVLPGFEQMTPEEKMNHPLYLEGFDVGRKVGQVEAEQKPEERRKDREYILNRILEYLEDNDCPIEWKNTILELSLLPQPKAGWSKEDEKMLSSIIMFLAGFMGNEEKIDFLKSLRPQPKQEWSEGDENALKYIHELISWGYAEKFMDAQTAHDMRLWVNEHLCRDTFQNGNSHWKPSEEQMRALGDYIDGEEISEYDMGEIVNLYHELKKLM